MADLDTDPFDPGAATARLRSLADSDDTGFWDKVGAARQAAGEAQQTGWVTRLPRNIGAGAYKAALNTIDTVTDVANEVVAGAVESSAVPVAPPPSVREVVPEFYDAAHAFGDSLSEDNQLSDDITQGVAQFALPFAAWMKGLQGVGMVGNIARGVVAETGTAATAFDPHDGRLADLAQLGQQAEGKFGDTLRKIAPDGSLVNDYVNYMTSRDGEGEWEGRFKNAVDSLAGTALIGGVIKGAATGFKLARMVATDPMKVGPAAQGGMVAFHGTPHQFERFSTGAIGTGEGSQSFGHGLYFAENKDTAGYYSRTVGKAQQIPDDVVSALRSADNLGFDNASQAMSAIRSHADWADRWEFGDPKGVETIRGYVGKPRNSPTVYTVDIQDDAAKNAMIDWDGALDSQPPKVQTAVSELVEEHRPLLEAYAAWANKQRNHNIGMWTRALMANEDVDGETVYRALAEVLGSQKAASDAFNAKGVKGLRYLDQGSRGAGEGTRNMVVFDDSLVKILGKE